jgi:hypothetical protein
MGRLMSRLVTILVLLQIFAFAQRADAVDFDTQIIPLLTKHGCNSGACHGAAAGRGGLRMSLYGSNPTFDFEHLVLELKGRRVNLSRPERSLIFRKPTETLSHGGGLRFESDSESAKLLIGWIKQGAGKTNNPVKLTRLDITPSMLVTDLNKTAKLRATATFSDGKQKDVTRWTIFHAMDPASVEVKEDTATIIRRGRHVVTARYLDQFVPVEFLVPINKLPAAEVQAKSNVVDRYVTRRLKLLHLPASARADDETLLRRIYLDLVGRLPEPSIVLAFVDNKEADKFTNLVDRLLKSDDFDTYWTYRFSEWLRIRTQPKDNIAAKTYYAWLSEQVAKNVGFDKIARTLITATGDTHQVGPANFYRTTRGAREQAEFASELFMGMRLRCANCHDHPLDRWTQDDYHGLAAIFAKVKGGRVIEINPRAEVSHPRTGSAAIPRIPGDSFLSDDQDGRKQFATWLTRKDNPYFAKAIVNRLWQSVMGRGLIEPTDDLRPTNVATHPELLESLAADFAAQGFDFRRTLRSICTSKTYSRSGVTLPTNKTDAIFFSHRLARKLRPEVFADSICDVTGVSEKYGDEPAGTRAVELFAGNLPAQTLDILGRCSRDTGCEESDVARTGNLPRALHLINGPLINGKVASPTGRLIELLKGSNDALIKGLYLRALTRRPTAKELDFWRSQLTRTATEQARRLVAEDILWSVLTSREFGSIR